MSTRITWWGHATTTIEMSGVRILTDPLLSVRLAHLRRTGSPVPASEALDAEIAVVSHLHSDHLHLPSLRRLPASTRILVPRGAARMMAMTSKALARRVEEISEGETAQFGDVTIRAVPALHDGRRMKGSRHVAPALGFHLSSSTDSATVWFAGDTGLFPQMAEIGPVEIAVVPIGGWGPTLGDEHLDPAQAARAVRRVAARDAVPIHFGTFWPLGLRTVKPELFQRMFQRPGQRFLDEMAETCPEVRAHLLLPGGTVDIPSRQASAESAQE